MIDLIYIYTLREFNNKACLNLDNMTFSPEDNFGSIPPTNTDEEDFDEKWGIDGLSLEGEETTSAETAGKEAEPEPTLEELGEMYRVPDKVSETPIVEAEKVESSAVSNETEVRLDPQQEKNRQAKEKIQPLIDKFKQLQKEKYDNSDLYTSRTESAILNGNKEEYRQLYEKSLADMLIRADLYDQALKEYTEAGGEGDLQDVMYGGSTRESMLIFQKHAMGGADEMFEKVKSHLAKKAREEAEERIKKRKSNFFTN